MNHHSAAASPSNGPTIEIRSGRTRFPNRPIVGDRMLIGAGSNCHLQLGGGMPMAHSVITRVQDGWMIEALVPEPALIVRGEAVRQTTLHDGDAIQLGPFALVAHLPAAVVPATTTQEEPLDVEALVALQHSEIGFAASLESLTAEEIVDAMATDLAAVTMAEADPTAGGVLLQEAAAAESMTAIDEQKLVADVLAQLAEMTAALEARSVLNEFAAAMVLPMTALEVPAPTESLRKSA